MAVRSYREAAKRDPSRFTDAHRASKKGLP
jgi:hypothetical protein